MARQPETTEESKAQLWEELQKGNACMLWIPGSDQHPQPMSHFADPAEAVIWFITSADTDLAAATGSGANAAMTFVSSAEDYHASLKGRLEIVENDAKLDELWSVPVAAWFEDGREDPSIRLLKFTPEEAAIWASQSSSILVGLKLMRAGMTEGAETPDVSMHRVIEFDRAA